MIIPRRVRQSWTYKRGPGALRRWKLIRRFYLRLLVAVDDADRRRFASLRDVDAGVYQVGQVVGNIRPPNKVKP